MSVRVMTIRRPMTWQSWLLSVSTRLASGDHLAVPSLLPHPSAVGFTRQSLAEPHGQVADWTLSLDDGSRLHVHEFPDGALRVHRDVYDPDRDVVSTVLHLATETTAGKVTLAVGVGVGVVKLFASLAEPPAKRRRPAQTARRAAARRRKK